MEKNLLTQTVKAAQKRDEAAMLALYTAYAKPIYHLALKLMRNKEDAEDIMQETFISAFAKLKNLNEPVTFQKWLGRIASNKCTDALRKRREMIDADIFELTDDITAEDSPLMLPEACLSDKETARMVSDIVDSLPAAQRMCIYYHYYQEIPVKEIAEMTVANEHTVRSRLNLAKKKIREEVERIDKEEGVKLYEASPLILFTPELFTEFLNEPVLSEAAELTTEAFNTVWDGVSASASAITSGASGAVSGGAASTTATVAASGASFKVAVTLIAAAAAITATVLGLGLLSGWFDDDDNINDISEPNAVEASVFDDDEPDEVKNPEDDDGSQYDYEWDVGAGYGNTSANIHNNGLIASDGEWFYYANSNDYGRLYKMRADGTERQELYMRECQNINIVGDWVYFTYIVVNAESGLYKIRKDGTEETLIYAASNPTDIMNPVVIGEYVYFAAKVLTENNKANICRIRTDGTEMAIIRAFVSTESYNNVISMYVDDGWVYFLDGDNIRKIRTDGTEETKLGVTAESFIVHEDWIYYKSIENSLNKIKTDGTGNLLLKENQYMSMVINAVGDYVYFTDIGGISRIKNDGTEGILFEIPFTAEYVMDYPRISIIGERLYAMHDGVFCSYALDGSDKQKTDNPNPDFDLPDFVPYTALDLGNTRSNVLNNARLVEYDGWVYFGTEGVIYKMKTDGSERTELITVTEEEGMLTAQNMRIKDGWLYFIMDGVNEGRYNIFKVLLNGEELTEIDASPEFMRIAHLSSSIYDNLYQGDWAYITRRDDNNTLYSVYVPDGTHYKLCDDYVSKYIFEGDWIYYINADDGNSLYKIRTDGMYRQHLAYGYINEFNVSGDWVYYASDYNIGRISTDGREGGIICYNVSGSDRNTLNVAGNLIYLNEHYQYYGPQLIVFDDNGHETLYNGTWDSAIQADS